MDQGILKSLTDAFCRGQPMPASGRLEFADLRCAGTSLFRITSKGSRTFCFRFRDPVTRASTRATIGSYPDVGLGAARARADAMRATVADGTNPSWKSAKAAPAPPSAPSALSPRGSWSNTPAVRSDSADFDDRNLNLHVLPKWKNWQIDDIRRADVIELVEGIVTAGKPVPGQSCPVAHIVDFQLRPRRRFDFGEPLRTAEEAGRRVGQHQDPDGRRNPPILAPVTSVSSQPRHRACPAVQLLTGARPSEAAEAALKEFNALNEGADSASWIIPGARTKNKRAHLVPLSPMALDAVRSGLEIIEEVDEFLFPSRVKRASPIDGHALAVAMRRMSESEKLTGRAVRPGRRARPLRMICAARLQRGWRS